MNSKWTKAVSYSLAGSAMVFSLTLTASATSALSGVSALSSTTGVLESASYTAFAGASLTVNDILSEAASISTETQLADSGAKSVSKGVEAEDDPYANIAIAQVDNYVYIRESASADSEYVGKLYNNSAATVQESVEAEDGTWLKITSGDVTGYVKSEFVVQNDENLAREVSRRLAKVETQTLYVREEATTESDVIDMIPAGDDLTVIDESTVAQGWVKVTCNAGEGFVSTDYVKLSTDFTVAESKNAEIARLAKEEEERKKAQEAALKATQAAKAVEERKKQEQQQSASAGDTAAQPAPERTYSAPSGTSGSSVAAYASQFVGNPYVYGGSSLTKGTDCSGFVMSVYGAYGVNLPHSSSALRNVGYGVSREEIQPGDIVCYSGHVAIYQGNGQIVHASTAKTGIKCSNVDYKKILAIRRIF
ncbi:MAG: SH3 domain-containing protein [Pseudobutyrivibrio sp.]|nr:SH3 domain-containing protein [Pseudobutyrivibrio sp.]